MTVVVWIMACTFVHPFCAAQDDEKERFFTEKIAPVLETRCLGCHSHASNTMEGGLTLDSRSGWINGGERGPAIVPGQPDKSLLIEAIAHNNPDLQMPPDEKLPEAEIELLTEWVVQGATDPRDVTPQKQTKPRDWWSLRPLNRPSVPKFANPDWNNNNEIDAFVQRKLVDNNLQPAPQADRRTLIRRLYLDLHGLPPTPQQVKEFIEDTRPDAYERLVDRLLNSPRYGERWARHWLDTVHFADTHGCEHDVFRPNAWRYRDYVIEGLNQDTPWKQFIREQLAADHFFPERSDLTPALGFIAAGPLELSRASTAPVTFDYLDRDDMVTQTMSAFTSTTIHCARCHNHKFDPITQADYYSLQAVFAGVGKGDIEFDVDPQVAAIRRKWTNLLEAVESRDGKQLLAEDYAELVANWESEFTKNAAVWEPLRMETFTSTDGATLTRLDDNSVLVSEHLPERDTYTISGSTSLDHITAVRLDVIADDSLPAGGPGRAGNGNLHLTEIEVKLFRPGANKATDLKIQSATADWNQQNWTIDHALDGNLATAWGIYPQVGNSHHAVFEFHEPVDITADSQFVVLLKQLHGGSHLIGRFRLHVTSANAGNARILPEDARIALSIPANQRNEAQRTAIAASALQQYAQDQLAQLPEPASVYAASNMYSHAKKLASPMAPKTVHVLSRGNIDAPKEVAVPGALAAIDSLPARFEISNTHPEAERRAALADWIADVENPLTWRSIVNRVWYHHFGHGLSDTLNDFGRMGEQPSHPELLDWLAVWFRDDANGSLKELHRKILLSATWQQASLHQTKSIVEHAKQIDSTNRLLWKMHTRRIDAETFRDSILQISGRLDLTMGGPGVQQFTLMPGQQATPKLDYKAFDWASPAGARRSIYRVVWRGIADPFMESLDFPDLGLLPSGRSPSVSSLQALTMFNNDFVLHHANTMAEQLKSENSSQDEQLARAFTLVYLRDPHPNEIELLKTYTSQYGLAATCRVLFNSNEFLFVD